MFDPSQILATKIDQILEKWMDAVRKDKHVESAKNLSDTALSNSLTILLDQLVKALSHSQAENKSNCYRVKFTLILKKVSGLLLQ
ncbi:MULTISPECIES: RsbRD N-terminal domain-containing protein [Aerosakkonema]|uniref:RsbRD N-terminal domain-containing protein n=1 Tax=Aerosakkonema TaxID=1246629 RepID=UPI0035BBD1A3